MIVAPGSAARNRHGQNAEDLVAPDHATGAVDCTQPVAVAIESQSEVELVVDDKPFEVGQILLFGRVRVMIGKTTVNVGVKRLVLAGQQRDELFDDSARCAIASIPADAERRPIRLGSIETLDQPRDIIVQDRVIADRAGTLFPVAFFGKLGQILDIGAKKWRVGKDHLEAVILGGIMAAGYLNAAIDLEHGLGIIEHWGRTEAYAHDIDPRLGQATHEFGDKRG